MWPKSAENPVACMYGHGGKDYWSIRCTYSAFVWTNVQNDNSPFEQILKNYPQQVVRIFTQKKLYDATLIFKG